MLLSRLFAVLIMLGCAALPLGAQEESAAAGGTQQATNTAAAAAVKTGAAEARTPDFLEHIVDVVLEAADVHSSGNTTTHYVIAMLFLVVSLFARHIVCNVIFAVLKKLAARTKTTFDDKLLPALETPAATLIMVFGVVGALKVLKLSEASDEAVRVGSTIAFSIVVFWGLLRTFGALLDHATEIAKAKQLGIAAFMPWIKKTLVTIFCIVGVLMIVQGLGFDVKALLAGLGIGGLAFALAAQDTLANVFGSIVVAIDQPFKIGETVRIGSFLGTIEDIGLRSTKLRAIDRSLVVIPNRTVANEAITNLARFTARRVEQIISLTYETPAEKMTEIVAEIRRIIESKPEVNAPDTHVYFRDYAASSLDIWVVYVFKTPDFVSHMRVRQQINLEIMQAVQSRGLSFAFPTQTLHVASLPPGSAPAHMQVPQPPAPPSLN
jgi:MscS family membrane protein